MTLQAPFPWFGGKSRATDLIWSRLGKVKNYVEPFFGSGAVLLGSPYIPGVETVNDKDGYIANFWRAVKHDPEKMAHYAEWPVNENDLHARHIYLVNAKQDHVPKLEGDPDYYDAKIAGWWVWGICCWIGSGFCSGNGPWQVVDGKLVHLGNKGRGVNRQRVHLGDKGRGVNRQRVHLGDKGQGVNRQLGVVEWMQELSDRLRRVRVCCGDWTRVCTPAVTTKHGLTAVVLDPPYSNEVRSDGLYVEDCGDVAAECREWAQLNGDDPQMRIVLCGYESEHELTGWTKIKWVGPKGMNATDNHNRNNETLWFSPHCLKKREIKQEELFS
jgi:hypothetical protein